MARRVAQLSTTFRRSVIELGLAPGTPGFRAVFATVLIGTSALGISTQAWAEPLRLEEPVAPACVAVARTLGPRIERTLGGSLPSELEASVAIDAFGAGYRLTIALRDAVEARGMTVIEAPTCDEAVDAAAVVLALAFADSTPSGPPREAASFGSPAEPVPTAPSAPPPVRADRRVALDHLPPTDSDRATRLTFATGVDAGTLPHSTLTLAGAVARSFGGLELAAVVRYGLPTVDETIETGFSESQRHDFGGLELRACHGVGHAVRVSACAGTEVGAVRASSSLLREGRADLDADHISPRLSGSLVALVAHRGGLIEPGLELGGAAVALGREAGAPWLVVRVAATAAFAF
ncbi:MAG TPA: hypothetical protein VNN72_01270 [Polyangiaceae bacterium]|nr:hypothetical protein [Polyangiaceae bacterium]